MLNLYTAQGGNFNSCFNNCSTTRPKPHESSKRYTQHTCRLLALHQTALTVAPSICCGLLQLDRCGMSSGCSFCTQHKEVATTTAQQHR
jgi:hypothetical protein